MVASTVGEKTLLATYMEGCHPWYDLEKRGTQHKFVRGLMQLGFLLLKNSAGGHGSLVKAFWRSKNLLSMIA